MIGCGRVSERHAVQMELNGSLVAVCDINKDKADQTASQYGAKAYYSLEDFLNAGEKADVVAVCTPNGFHARQSIQILEAGMDVLCEKPMAIFSLDCIKMNQAAEKAGRQLFIVKQNRFNPPVVAVKKLIDDGRLGEIYSVQLNCFWNRNDDYYKNTWKGTKNLDGGTLYTQFSHFIDLLYWFLGDVEPISVQTRNYHHKGVIEFEDTGIVNLQFRNGAIGNINYTVNAYKKNMEGSLTLFAEKGTVKIGGEYLNELEYQLIEGDSVIELSSGNPPNHYGHYVGSMSNHDMVYQNLVAVLNGKEAVAANGKEGFKTVEIIEKIYRLANEQRSK